MSSSGSPRCSSSSRGVRSSNSSSTGRRGTTPRLHIARWSTALAGIASIRAPAGRRRAPTRHRRSSTRFQQAPASSRSSRTAPEDPLNVRAITRSGHTRAGERTRAMRRRWLGVLTTCGLTSRTRRTRPSRSCSSVLTHETAPSWKSSFRGISGRRMQHHWRRRQAQRQSPPWLSLRPLQCQKYSAQRRDRRRPRVGERRWGLPQAGNRSASRAAGGGSVALFASAGVGA
mmetsp:Transcript_14625/g.47792  ORF Transcript_14625/g.47792 Transcript_14625/m.47792 type:complete len:230 (+) Transcript_14625:828-1517(+)